MVADGVGVRREPGAVGNQEVVAAVGPCLRAQRGSSATHRGARDRGLIVECVDGAAHVDRRRPSSSSPGRHPERPGLTATRRHGRNNGHAAGVGMTGLGHLPTPSPHSLANQPPTVSLSSLSPVLPRSCPALGASPAGRPARRNSIVVNQDDGHEACFATAFEALPSNLDPEPARSSSPTTMQAHRSRASSTIASATLPSSG